MTDVLTTPKSPKNVCYPIVIITRIATRINHFAFRRASVPAGRIAGILPTRICVYPRSSAASFLTYPLHPRNHIHRCWERTCPHAHKSQYDRCHDTRSRHTIASRDRLFRKPPFNFARIACAKSAKSSAGKTQNCLLGSTGRLPTDLGLSRQPTLPRMVRCRKIRHFHPLGGLFRARLGAERQVFRMVLVRHE